MISTRGNPAMLKAAIICGLLALFCLWAVIASAEDKGLRVAFSVMAVGQTADLVSTVQALNRGAVETNPLLGSKPSTAKLVALKLPMIGVGFLLAKITPQHPKLAKGLAYTIGGVGAALALSNARKGRR